VAPTCRGGGTCGRPRAANGLGGGKVAAHGNSKSSLHGDITGTVPDDLADLKDLAEATIRERTIFSAASVVNEGTGHFVTPEGEATARVKYKLSRAGYEKAKPLIEADHYAIDSDRGEAQPSTDDPHVSLNTAERRSLPKGSWRYGRQPGNQGSFSL
jgi:hypothetical protein